MKIKLQIRIVYLVSIMLWIAILMPFTSIAQSSDFRMKDYLYRTPGMRALGLSIHGNISNTSNTTNYTYGLQPSTAYNKQYSTDKSQLDLWNFSNLSINRLPSYEVVGLPDSLNKQEPRKRKLSLGSNVYWIKRNYKGKNFFEYGSNSGINLANSSNTSDKRVLNYISLNPIIGIGHGRLEYVSNSQMALFIIDDLQKAGKIKGSVPADKVYKLTELITQLYNTRVFDYRRRRNYEVGKIDSFLTENKIISSNDITVYNIIADNWNYSIQPRAIESTSFFSGSLQVPYSPVTDRINTFGVLDQAARYSGQRTTLKLYLPSVRTNTVISDGRSYDNTIGGLDFAFFNSEPLDSNIETLVTTQTGYNAQILWENYNPRNLHFQDGLVFSASVGNVNNSTRTVFKRSLPDSVIESSNFTLNVGGRYIYSWFPNSRTILTLTTSIDYGSIKNKVGNLTSFNVSGLTLGTNFRTSYFINYNSRIGATLTFSAIPVSSNNIKPTSFGITINYVNFIF